MDFYLLRDQPLMFDGAGKEIKPGFLMKRSTPVENELAPVVDRPDDPKEYCLALALSLTESSQEMKDNWRIIPTVTVDLTLGSTPTDPATIRLSSIDKDPGWKPVYENISFFKRMWDLYGVDIDVNVSLNVTFKTLDKNCEGQTIEFQAKDDDVYLSMENATLLEKDSNLSVPDKNDDEDDLDYGYEFTQTDIPEDVLRLWRQEETFHGSITVIFTLTQECVNGLNAT